MTNHSGAVALLATLVTTSLTLSSHAGGEGDSLSCSVDNPSFELGPGLLGNPVSGWTNVGFVGLSSTMTTHGSRAVYLTGPFTGELDYSRLYNIVECYSGWQHTLKVDVGHTASNPLVGSARAYFTARWMNDGGDVLAEKIVTLLNAASPTDEMFAVEYAFDPAPNGTRKVQVELSFLQTAAQEGGRAWVDNLQFSRKVPLVNQWGDFGSTSLDFSGHTWRVKNAYQGPGPNIFSDSSEHATIQSDGSMALTIRQTNGQWRCAEVVNTEALGYGTYRWHTSSRLDQLDPNIIFSPFLWEYAQCYDGNGWWNPPNEFDIEFSRWGDPNRLPAQFVAQPYDWPGNMERFDIPEAVELTSELKWTSDAMHCAVWVGHDDAPTEKTLVHSWTYTGVHLPRPEQPRVHINLWMLNGNPPSNNQPQTVVIKAFDFEPVDAGEDCPADLNNDGTVNGGDLGLLLSAWNEAGPGNLNGDGTVSGADLGLILSAWGNCAP